jgi:hypothetical protein
MVLNRARIWPYRKSPGVRVAVPLIGVALVPYPVRERPEDKGTREVPPFQQELVSIDQLLLTDAETEEIATVFRSNADMYVARGVAPISRTERKSGRLELLVPIRLCCMEPIVCRRVSTKRYPILFIFHACVLSYFCTMGPIDHSRTSSPVGCVSSQSLIQRVTGSDQGQVGESLRKVSIGFP